MWYKPRHLNIVKTKTKSGNFFRTWTFLNFYLFIHRAVVITGDEFSAGFLIKNNADVNMTTHLDKETPLHMTASFNPEITDPEVMQGMARITELLLNHGAVVNSQDTAGR